jgi:hypothetical protein
MKAIRKTNVSAGEVTGDIPVFPVNRASVHGVARGQATVPELYVIHEQLTGEHPHRA